FAGGLDGADVGARLGELGPARGEERFVRRGHGVRRRGGLGAAGGEPRAQERPANHYLVARGKAMGSAKITRDSRKARAKIMGVNGLAAALGLRAMPSRAAGAARPWPMPPPSAAMPIAMPAPRAAHFLTSAAACAATSGEASAAKATAET